MGEIDFTAATETDVRSVAIIWRNDDDGDGRPKLILSGVSEFEALGLLKAAALRLGEDCTDLIDVDGDDDDPEE